VPTNLTASPAATPAETVSNSALFKDSIATGAVAPSRRMPFRISAKPSSRPLAPNDPSSSNVLTPLNSLSNLANFFRLTPIVAPIVAKAAAPANFSPDIVDFSLSAFFCALNISLSMPFIAFFAPFARPSISIIIFSLAIFNPCLDNLI